MQVQKHIIIKLFRTPEQHYLQIGDTMYPIKEKFALMVAEKEGIEIRKGDGVKEIQIMSNEDKK